MNYQQIEEELKKVQCPVCYLSPTEVSITTDMFTMEVGCKHKELLQLIETEYDRLKKEQLDIN